MKVASDQFGSKSPGRIHKQTIYIYKQTYKTGENDKLMLEFVRKMDTMDGSSLTKHPTMMYSATEKNPQAIKTP